jgi:hypothetical protein
VPGAVLLAVVAGLGLGLTAAGPASATGGGAVTSGAATGGRAVHAAEVRVPVPASVAPAGRTAAGRTATVTAVAAGRVPSGPVAQLGVRRRSHYHSSYHSNGSGGSSPGWLWAIVGVAFVVGLIWVFARRNKG